MASMTHQEREQAIRRVRENLLVHIAHCAKIKDKAGKIVPFRLNRAQRYVHERLEMQIAETGMARALILKGRQQGISTYLGERFYHQVTTRGKSAFIVAHEDKATSNLFEMVKRYHQHNPLAPSTRASNAKELIFGALDAGYKLATAGTDDVGRSNTAQLIHGCLAGDTLILMADGSLRAIETLEPGDLVRTRRGDVAPVKGISWHTDRTREVRVALNGLPLRATDSHKFWTRRGMVKLGDLEVGDELGFPVREITGEVRSVPFSIESSSRVQGGGRAEVCGPDEIDLTFDVGRMLGLYLAEGHVALQSKAPHEPSSVVFACHEREVERNTSWVRCVGGFSSLSERANKGSKTRMTVAYGRQFASFVLRMCGRTNGKHLPDQWWRMPREFVRGMLVGYLAGDGHSSPSRDRRIQAPSIAPAIAYGMRDVVAALGYGFPAVGYRPGAVRNGRNEKAQYTLRITGPAVDEIAPMLGWEMPPRKKRSSATEISDGSAWLPIQSIGEYVEEKVWDIEVDHPDHDYCLTQCATSNSEFAYWRNPQMHLAGLGNTVADMPGSEVILESTANGQGNAFHLMWQEGEAGRGLFIPIFVPWFWQDEYRAPVRPDLELSSEDVKYQLAYGLDREQMQWRANKISSYGSGFEWLFDQEYPATPSVAFQSATQNPLISPHDVMAAVNSTFVEGRAPLVVGCDPAGDGANTPDRTAIAFRRGRMCSRIEYHEGLNTMQIAGKLAGYWNEMRPDAMFIDKTGLGTGVVDRLQELNIPAVGIHNAGAPMERDTFENKKAEMWYAMKDWFENQPCRIPNDPSLISDITAPKPHMSSKGLKMVEKKESLEKRGIRSPDGADALALTFAMPVSYRLENNPAGYTTSHTPATSAGY